jgi:hypothetical protein
MSENKTKLQTLVDSFRSTNELCRADALLAADKLEAIADAWGKYVAYLKDKYPPLDNEPWGFACEHHRVIDDAVSS